MKKRLSILLATMLAATVLMAGPAQAKTYEGFCDQVNSDSIDCATATWPAPKCDPGEEPKFKLSVYFDGHGTNPWIFPDAVTTTVNVYDRYGVVYYPTGSFADANNNGKTVPENAWTRVLVERGGPQWAGHKSTGSIGTFSVNSFDEWGSIYWQWVLTCPDAPQ